MMPSLKIQNKQRNNSSLASNISTHNQKSSYNLESIKHMETNKPLDAKINYYMK